MRKEHTVLIIANSPKIMQLLAKFIQDEGYSVVMTSDSSEAKQFIEHHQVTLILMDLYLESTDSVSFCKSISTEKGLPFIFIAPKSDSENIIKVFTAGAVDYITKPFNFHELGARIRHHIQLKEYQDQLRSTNMKLENALKKVEEAALTDHLTRLWNRRAMINQLKTEENRSKRTRSHFALIMYDIDNFKNINDTYGHDCGDMVLKEVANVFQASIRQEDSAARWGGEEFLILLTEMKSDNAFKKADDIRQSISELEMKYEKKEIKVSVSAGVSVYVANMNYETIIRQADEALYHSKNNGKNQVTIYSDLIAKDRN